MTPNWPELWAREPGLRPELDGAVAHVLNPDSDLPCWVWRDEVGDSCLQTRGVLPALSRDAAVRWLGGEGAVIGQDGMGWDVESGWGDMGRPLGTAPDLDAALFAACKAVLDSRVPSRCTANDQGAVFAKMPREGDKGRIR